MRLRSLWWVGLAGACSCGSGQLVVTMNPDNNSGQSGFATITDFGASMRVVVETSAPDFDSPQAAHIHDGNCGEVGRIVVGLQPLTALKDQPGRYGSTTTVTSLQFDAFKQGEWAINVHDARDSLVYVSCGRVPQP